MIHVIRDKDGALMATARGVTPEAAAGWKASGYEIFAFEIELPQVQVGADIVQVSRELDG